MKQTYTSKDTSINSSKLPALYSKVNFSELATCCGLAVLDWGCGKFNNGKEFIEDMGCDWYGYDPYNRSEEENAEARCIVPDCILCANVLNVIDSDESIQILANRLMCRSCPYFVSVYEGNRSGKGKATKKDCYQRNQKTSEYLRFFPGAVIRHGVITNCPEAVI